MAELESPKIKTPKTKSIRKKDFSMPRILNISEQIPKEIHFGLCAVEQFSERSFTVENFFKKTFRYEFSSGPFVFTPSTGVINSKSKHQFVVSFKPKDATIIEVIMQMKIEDDESVQIKLTATGKYPFLKILETSYDFGETIVGKSVFKELVIKNLSEVSTKFFIQKLSNDDYTDNCFYVENKSGVINSNEKFTTKIFFNPPVSDSFSCVNFIVGCDGGNTLNVQCMGMAKKYDMILSTHSLNFGSIKLSNNTSRLITLTNNSELASYYEFFNDPGNIFSISNGKGIVNAKSHVRVIIYFNPQKSVNYYERLYCLVRNHVLLYIDCIGNCYDLLIRPAPISQIDIDNWEEKKNLNESLNYDNLLKSLQVGKSIAYSASMNNFESENKLKNPQEDTGMSLNLTKKSQAFKKNAQYQVLLHKNLMRSQTDENAEIFVSEEVINFGYCITNIISPGRTLQVHNNTNKRITVYWTFQVSSNENIPIFEVHPSMASLKANASYGFTVKFRPTQKNTYFFQWLQLFAVEYDENAMMVMKEKKKLNLQTSSTKDFQLSSTLNEGKDVFPPHQIVVRLFGHSFTEFIQPFIPMIYVIPETVIEFPPCAIGECNYQSFVLKNDADTPTYFRCLPDSEKVFKTFPSCGLIGGKSIALILVEFQPKDARSYKKKLVIHLNHNSEDRIKLKLIGYCCKPNIEIQNEGKIFFPPAFIGVFSKQNLKIRNKSRISLNFAIIVPRKYQHEIIVEPAQGLLRPNESIFLLFSFIPVRKKEYHVKLLCLVTNAGCLKNELIDEVSNKYNTNKFLRSSFNPSLLNDEIKIFPIELWGEGGDGSLVIEPRVIDYGTVKVGFVVTKKLVIQNLSNITFYVEFMIEDYLPPDSSVIQTNTMVKYFKLDRYEGIIGGNSKFEIHLTFEPDGICEPKIKINCIAREHVPVNYMSQFISSKKIVVQKCSAVVSGKGSYPALKIVDIRNETMSVATLWNNFEIHDINQFLMSNLTESEKKFNNIQKFSFNEVKEINSSLNEFNFNFGFLQNKHPIIPRKIILTIQNVGGTDLDWSFKLSNGSSFKADAWADTGELSEDEALEKIIVTKKIFDMIPRSGTLAPNTKKDVELIYSPNIEEDIFDKKGERKKKEEHYLVTILHILNSKAVRIKFKGTTLAPLSGELHIPLKNYYLPPVPIGMVLPVQFPIKVQNVGSVKIACKIDQKKLYELNNLTSEMKEFTIKDLEMGLNPGEKLFIQTLFRPFEAKKYTFTVPIKTYDFITELDSFEIKFHGEGYAGPKPLALKEEKKEIPNQRSSSKTQIGGKAFFSLEEIDFGEVMNNTELQHYILLYNSSDNLKLSYEFQLPTTLVCNDNLTITPVKGVIKAGGFQDLLIKLIPQYPPSFYEGEIECLIIWENETGINFKNQSQLKIEKEMLFLRIKKNHILHINDQSLSKEYMLLRDFPPDVLKEQTKSLMDVIFDKVFKEILNEQTLKDNCQKMFEPKDSISNFFAQYDDFPSVTENEVPKVNTNTHNTITPSYGDVLVDSRNQDLMKKYFYELFQEIITDGAQGKTNLNIESTVRNAAKKVTLLRKISSKEIK